MKFDKAVRVLERYGRVSYTNEDEVSAQCPAHDDYHPSLSLARGRDGKRAVMYCHAGCSYERIVEALNALDRGDEKGPAAAAPPMKPVARVIEYELRDLDGTYVGTHLRQEDADGNKLGVPWVGLNGRKLTDLPLYGSEFLRAQLEYDPDTVIYLCEGEKAWEALRDQGVFALATVCGAGHTPSDEVLSCLVGCDVVLDPDNDEAGRKHMQRIGLRLEHLNRQQEEDHTT